MSEAIDMTRMRGRLAQIAPGRSLRVVIEGPHATRRPLVLLEAGSFGFSADWAAVQEKLAAEGLRSLAYDRAGLGFSPAGHEPRDSGAVCDDLEALLAALDEPGPYILCGHSMAGLHVRVFAARHPEKVLGVVLVDAVVPEAMSHPAANNMVSGFTKISRLAAWGARRGLQRPLAGALGDAIGLSAVAKAEKQQAFADPGHNHWAAAEVDAWHADVDQALPHPLDPAWPVAVVLTGDGRAPAARHALQASPAVASRHGSVIHVPGANHASLLGERHAGHIVGAILQVEAAAKEAAAKA